MGWERIIFFPIKIKGNRSIYLIYRYRPVFINELTDELRGLAALEHILLCVHVGYIHEENRTLNFVNWDTKSDKQVTHARGTVFVFLTPPPLPQPYYFHFKRP
jgi:hypothetical protein